MSLCYKPSRQNKKIGASTLKQQFVAKVTWDVDDRGCWIANGYDYRGGYKQLSFKIDGEFKLLSLHRVAYEVFKTAIPEGKCVMHSCDNPSCINPEHLSVGTRRENTKDMLRKGRDRFSPQKLTDQDVFDIRSSGLGSYKLAEIYDVTPVHIRRIRNGSRR
jgi:hypothetical protein